ncbi:helix-turn-helix domain-containing protein [Dyadobacter sp. LHD-138]|uniref:helix-turn-helix domain-containing protein n=1 Tax=Dyadobacter sp. LHD-138 TaxID=3071413 RepID=UPI0038D3CECB
MQIFQRAGSQDGHSVSERDPNRACSEELLETQYNVDKISLECGYKNITNFYQQFQKIVGTTPLNFRNKTWLGFNGPVPNQRMTL